MTDSGIFGDMTEMSGYIREDTAESSNQAREAILKIVDGRRIGQWDTKGLACNNDDFTVQVKREVLLQALQMQEEMDPGSSAPFFTKSDSLLTSIDGKAWIYFFEDKKWYCLKARMSATSCHNGSAFSITLRKEEWAQVVVDEAKTVPSSPDETRGEKWRNLAGAELRKLDSPNSKNVAGKKPRMEAEQFPPDFCAGFAPSIDQFDPGSSKRFLFEFDIVAALLGEMIFPKGDAAMGLIVVSGSTGGGKSQVVRRLIAHYLQTAKPEKRRHHLVSIEDPIETKLTELDNAHCAVADQVKWPMDYTPRRLKLDVNSLEQAVMDCKRMTPSLVNVGETRLPSDWRALMEFSGSGHLAITTTHAGSAVETVQRILRAVDARTPADRGNLSQSLLAVIHLAPFELSQAECDGNSGNWKATVPSVWRNRSGGSVGLVSDGLASIVPGEGMAASGRGRHSIAKQLRVPWEKNNPSHRTLMAPYWDRLLVKCAEQDLGSI